MLNMLVETIIRSCMKVTSVMMTNANNKKHTLQVIPNDIWIINKNNAGIQPTTHREDHNNTHRNTPQNNSSHIKEQVKIPETKMVPLHTVQSVNQ